MVTYRQVGRGIARTMRAVHREAKRAERRRLVYEKAAQKQAMLEAAAEAADEYARLIETLTGAHRINFQRRDWHTTASAPRVADPIRSSTQEDAARLELDRYRPSWFAKAFGLARWRRAKLSAAIEAARRHDKSTFNRQLKEAADRNDEIDYAQRLVACDPTTVVGALGRFSQLGELPFSIEGIDVVFVEGGRIVAMIDGLDLEDMPDRSVTLLQSGKASIKDLPRSRVLELHRDNICSAAVRAALEFLQTLPIETIEVVVQSDLLDRGSGHIGAEPVLYLRTTAQALAAVNLQRADATALVERLGGHFDWSRREGFRSMRLEDHDIPKYEN